MNPPHRMHRGARGCRRRARCSTGLVLLTMGFALAGCGLAPRVARVPSPKHSPIAGNATDSVAPTATPTPTNSPRPSFEESDLADTPTPTPEKPLDNTAPVVGGAGTIPSAPEPESMLTRINATTPPNTAAAYRLIEEARQLRAHGDTTQALHRLERSVTIDPLNPYGYYFLAQVHNEARAYDQAIAFAGRAAALAARSDRDCAARAFSLQGTVYERVGRFGDARQAYTKALQNDPRCNAARAGLGRLSGN